MYICIYIGYSEYTHADVCTSARRHLMLFCATSNLSAVRWLLHLGPPQNNNDSIIISSSSSNDNNIITTTAIIIIIILLLSLSLLWLCLILRVVMILTIIIIIITIIIILIMHLGPSQRSAMHTPDRAADLKSSRHENAEKCWFRWSSQLRPRPHVWIVCKSRPDSRRSRVYNLIYDNIILYYSIWVYSNWCYLHYYYHYHWY